MRRTSTERERARLNVEPLEGRLLLAGNVRVTLDDGELRIIGDNRSNCIEIDTHRGELRIRGCDGTDINGEEGDFRTDEEIEDVFIQLKRGNDVLTVEDVDLDDADVSIHMNQGRDTVNIDNVHVDGDVHIGMGEDDDELNISRSSADDVSIDGKSGTRDRLNIEGDNDFDDFECAGFERGTRC